MKKILYLHSSSDLYGSDRCLLRTIEGLGPTQLNPIVCLPCDGPLVEELHKLGVVTHVLDLAVLRRSELTLLGLVRYPFNFLVSLLKITRLAKSHNIKIVHSNTSAVIVGGVMSRMLGLSHIWHVREIIIQPLVVRRLINFFLRHFATVVVGVSRSVIDNIALDQPSIRTKATVIHDGIETEQFNNGDRAKLRHSYSLSESEVLVGMIGRISHWKGQDLFMSVAKELIKTHPSARFIAVGSPFIGQEHLMQDLRQKVVDSELNGRVIVEDFRNDIRDVLASLDIFVLPSTSPDPFPNTVLEAMAAGKPVVANAHGGVVEMLEDGKSGYLVVPNDVTMMADRIGMLIKDVKLRESFGREAQRRVNQLFNVSVYTERINALYLDVLNSE